MGPNRMGPNRKGPNGTGPNGYSGGPKWDGPNRNLTLPEKTLVCQKFDFAKFDITSYQFSCQALWISA
jgi:hypothetical protein